MSAAVDNDDLFAMVYHELRKLAAAKIAQEQIGLTLTPTALVHEAYLRIGTDQVFQNRGHFYAAAGEAMRRVLVEAARRRHALKRGSQAQRLEVDLSEIIAPMPDEELIALNEALERLAAKDPVKAELVKLRYFAGLSADEAAEILGFSASTANRHWTYARAWLKRAMTSE
jgi:RNA polymerase sigma factor (TIGR02999 family)